MTASALRSVDVPTSSQRSNRIHHSLKYRFSFRVGFSSLPVSEFSAVPVLVAPFLSSRSSSTVFLRSRSMVRSSRRRRFLARKISRSGIVAPANSGQMARHRKCSLWKTRISARSRAFAEFEADLIRLRTREGVKIARAKGADSRANSPNCQTSTRKSCAACMELASTRSATWQSCSPSLVQPSTTQC